MVSSLLGLASIAGGGGSGGGENKSSATASASSEVYSTTGAFNVGTTQGSTNIIFIIAGVVALAFLLMRRK